MKKIFPFKTYVLTFCLNDLELQLVNNLLNWNGISCISKNTTDEASDYFAANIKLLFVCINSSLIPPLEQQKIEEMLQKKNIALITFTNDRLEEAKEKIENLLKTFSPKGSEEALRKATKMVLPKFFPNSMFQNLITATPNTPFDYVASIDCISASWYGKMSLFFNYEKIIAQHESLKEKTNNELNDLFCEFTNQLAGIITQSLVQLKIETQGSLVVGMNLNTSAVFKIVGFLPGIRLTDASESICIQLSSELTNPDPQFQNNFVLKCIDSMGKIDFL